MADKPTAPPAPIVEREATYPIRFTAADGSVVEGAFRFRATTPVEEHVASLRAANLANGAAWESLDSLTRVNLAAIGALLTLCVEAPDWYPLEPAKMLEWPVEFNAALEAEARRHSAAYFRGRGPASGIEAFKRGMGGRVVVTVQGR